MKAGKADIKITGVQMCGEESDTTVTISEGTYTVTRDGCVMEYIENVAEDMEVHNTITITSGQALIAKHGAIESKMQFIPGEMSNAEYRTPFGNIDMDIACERIDWEEEERAAEGKIVYRLYSGGQPVADCITTIEVRLVP